MRAQSPGHGFSFASDHKSVTFSVPKYTKPYSSYTFEARDVSRVKSHKPVFRRFEGGNRSVTLRFPPKERA